MTRDDVISDSSPTPTRRELGGFLRSRRERLTPAAVGLPATGRRRTPGLRREEVAVLAGVGVTWYTWLEQGRSINVSAHVLKAVGKALQLDEPEMLHMQRLAGIHTPAVDAVECDPALLAAFQPILDKLDPYPACVQTPLFDVVAYNHAYRYLFADMDAIPAADRNCAVQFFTNETWRSRYLDPDVVAHRMVARLRSSASSATDADEQGVIGRLLTQSEEFSALWQRHDILLGHYEAKRLNSPLVGPLELSFVSTDIADSGHRLTVMTPLDEETLRKLERLVTLAQTDASITMDDRPATAAPITVPSTGQAP